MLAGKPPSPLLGAGVWPCKAGTRDLLHKVEVRMYTQLAQLSSQAASLGRAARICAPPGAPQPSALPAAQAP